MVNSYVIIPVHKTPISLVDSCIRSIKDNGFMMENIIIVLDKNTEKYDESIKKHLYDTGFSRAVVLTSKGVGMLDTRFVGYRYIKEGYGISSHDIIYYCDSDDTYEPDLLTEISRIFDKNDEEIIYSDSCNYNDISAVQWSTNTDTPNPESYISGRTYIGQLTDGQIKAYMPCKAVRSDIFNQVLSMIDSDGFTKKPIYLGEDLIFSLYLGIVLCYHKSMLQTIGSVLYNYDNKGLSAKHSKPSPYIQMKEYKNAQLIRDAIDYLFNTYLDQIDDMRISSYGLIRNKILYSICKVSHNDYCGALIKELNSDYSQFQLKEYSERNRDCFKGYGLYKENGTDK